MFVLFKLVNPSTARPKGFGSGYLRTRPLRLRWWHELGFASGRYRRGSASVAPAAIARMLFWVLQARDGRPFAAPRNRANIAAHHAHQTDWADKLLRVARVRVFIWKHLIRCHIPLFQALGWVLFPHLHARAVATTHPSRECPRVPSPVLVCTHARSRVGAHETHATDVADVRDERDGVNRRVQPPARAQPRHGDVRAPHARQQCVTDFRKRPSRPGRRRGRATARA